MSFNADSDEMADNFRQALEDLTGNTKHEINNLTLIARESTEHAFSIAEVIMDHILKVAPHKKLASLYVLDSIVKNVGSPYNLFFSRNLYKTFMEAYAVVDQQTRRKMEEMLRTWKEPVPGSIDRTPVFEPDTVGPIEKALMHFKGVGMQNVPRRTPIGGASAQQQPYRHTPTPPQPGRYGPPLNGGVRLEQPFPVHPAPPYPSAHSTPQSFGSAQGPYPAPGPGAPYGVANKPGVVDRNSLSGDISQLVEVMRTEAARNPHDISLQTKIGALQDLQMILQGNQDLPQEQLVLVKNQVTELAMTIRAAPAPAVTGPPPPLPPPPPAAAMAAVRQQTATPPVMSPPVGHHSPFPPPPVHHHMPPHVVAPPASGTPPTASPKVSLSSLLGPSAMAAIMKAKGQSNTVKGQKTPPPAAHMAIRPPRPHSQAPKSQVDPATLIAMLRSKGIIGGKPTAGPAPPRDPKHLKEAVIGLEFKSSSLKQYRPYMPSFISDKLGPQCSQCGRRFTQDEQGRAKKMAHMDWHFKVHKRIAEDERRGQHLSWYVDEMEWIRWEEAIDADHHGEDAGKSAGAGGADAGGSGKAGSKPQREKWIRVPDDSRLKASVCPICQEPFQMSWLDEAQEFVWMDAVQINDRIYHATCHAEAALDREKSPLRQIRDTPEPVLGKRKADDEYSSRNKIRLGV